MQVLMGQIHTLLAVLLCHVVTQMWQNKTFLKAVKCSSSRMSMSFECAYCYLEWFFLEMIPIRLKTCRGFRKIYVGLGLNHLGKGADFPSFFLHVDPNLSGRKKNKKKTAVTGLSQKCRKIKS